MGFRSSFISVLTSIKWDEWFVSKWGEKIHFHEKSIGIISSKDEYKIYDDDLFKDIQKVLSNGSEKELRMVLLHECGGITLVDITKDSIKYIEPDSFSSVDFITHNYCDGCSLADDGN